MQSGGYPRGYEKNVRLADGAGVFLRPVKPTDLDALSAFFKRLSPQSIYNRWLTVKKTLPEEEARYYVNTNFKKDMAIYAFSEDNLMRGAVRIMGNPDKSTEFAIVIEDDWQNRGLGHLLMGYIIQIAKDKGYRKIYGEIFRENTVMLKVCGDLGFSTLPVDADVARAVLDLD
jgi:acetyltransferase